MNRKLEAWTGVSRGSGGDQACRARVRRGGPTRRCRRHRHSALYGEDVRRITNLSYCSASRLTHPTNSCWRVIITVGNNYYSSIPLFRQCIPVGLLIIL